MTQAHKPNIDTSCWEYRGPYTLKEPRLNQVNLMGQDVVPDERKWPAIFPTDTSTKISIITSFIIMTQR